ncbi:SapC family protein [Rhodoplanes sp. TEM]|uniref:SapC family protein n=1 Tax=Rhodoplanes tepidamans TaxID=200616 RepID=A0ABT5JAM8_RHOTP|nr:MULTISPECIES: SapC family protein [Rhodoplanes]MDC7786700.1 SapC family protein [Rhodoplanes tepidamans]MDC7983706.1 SapC family protein [Rhodoplanes sp. TEM]MDQ0358136.1 hypothetical protein [Rhodoplanes tepidamans]
MRLAEHPIALDGDALSRRIFAPVAYRIVRDTAVVPIVIGEVFRLASFFPVVWRRREEDLDLVVVRALIDEAGAQPAGLRGVHPLVLQAYPFVLATRVDDACTRLIDDAVADAPTDIGASVTAADGRPSLATTLRLRMLELVERQLPLTRAVGRALADADLLQPWDLTFDIEGSMIGIPDLSVARQEAFATGAYGDIVGRHGAAAAELLGFHRISLFRAGVVVAAARAHVRERLARVAEMARRAEPGAAPGPAAAVSERVRP